MILTEDEAKTKRCYTGVAHHCLASECMAWNWVNRLPYRSHRSYDGEDRWTRQDEPLDLRKQLDVPPSWQWAPGDCDMPGRWMEPTEEANVRRTGCCGLAGGGK